MRLYFFIILVVTFILNLQLEALSNPGLEKRVIISQVGTEKYRMRLYLNAENPYETSSTFVESASQLSTTLPIPNRFDVIDMKAHIKYTASINIDNDGSTIALKMNKNFIKQVELLQKGIGGEVTIVDYQIPIDKLYEGYNTLCIAIQQKGKAGSSSGGSGDSENSRIATINRCVNTGQFPANAESSGGTATSSILTQSSIWTQIDTRNSYIEFTFKLKPFEEKISSIYKYMFDNKNQVSDKINFIFPTAPTEQDIQNYGLMANIIGTILKFKDLDFSVSTEIMNNRNNVIIMTKDKAIEFLKKYDDENSSINSKITGNINLIANPKNSQKGILLITGENQTILESAILRIGDSDLALIDDQSITVVERSLPEKSKPFSTTKFFPFDVEVPFSKLKYETKTLSGLSIGAIYMDFLVYPIFNFDENSSLAMGINSLSADNNRLKVITNLFFNGNFVHQFIDTKQFNSVSTNDFKMTESKDISASIIKGGKNTMRLDIAVLPRQGSTVCAPLSIQATIKDDSYFYIPKGKIEVEYPHLKYISDMAFPFSIYPDLQNTGILITDFYADTIASAMHIAFQLGKTIDYPGYRMTITYDINKILDKDIIVLGGQIERYAPLYENSPIKFTKMGMQKESLIRNELDKRVKMQLKTVENVDFSNYLVAQTYKSPFNPNRIVFELLAKTPKTLLKGIQEGLIAKNLGNFDGDLWLYNIESEKSYSYRMGEKYKIKDLIDGYEKERLYENDEYRKITEF
jgi:hypothetical protein